MPERQGTMSGTPQLSKKWRLDVNTGTHASPVWVQVKGLKSILETFNRTTADPTNFDDGVWTAGPFTTGLSWQLAGSYSKNLYSGAEDPGQAALRGAAIPTGDNQPSQIEVRWYDRLNTAG